MSVSWEIWKYLEKVEKRCNSQDRDGWKEKIPSPRGDH